MCSCIGNTEPRSLPASLQGLHPVRENSVQIVQHHVGTAGLAPPCCQIHKGSVDHFHSLWPQKLHHSGDFWFQETSKAKMQNLGRQMRKMIRRSDRCVYRKSFKFNHHILEVYTIPYIYITNYL